MTDREMLEYAAKAMGIVGEWSDEGLGCIIRRPLHFGEKPYHWNPLQNDSQAFRLAMKLSMHIASTATQVLARAISVHVEYYSDDLFESNLMKAARLAVVRAAAEVGAKMP